MSPVPGNQRKDPHNTDDDSMSVAEANIIIAVSSSDSSDDEDAYYGYQILPQDSVATPLPAEINTDNMENASDDNLQVSANLPYIQVPEITASEIEERRSLWSETRLQPQEQMDESHIIKIKSALSSFQLSDCQVPDWARVIPEEDWKSQLLSQLHNQPSNHHCVNLCVETSAKSIDQSASIDEQQPVSDDEGASLDNI